MTTTAQGNLAMIERARRATAAEVYDIGTRFPSVFVSAQGSWMTDVEGKRILDVTAASGSLLLGNQHPYVTEAVTRCLRECGVVFASTLTPQRIELAERLCDRYPAGEKAVFCKTGSEATTTAIRMARAATGRDLILTSGYHGWHDWQLSYLHLDFEPRTDIVNFSYNETALARLLEEFSGDIAGVFVTPEPAWFDVAYHQRLSDLCARYGVPFIIDEVITALRWGPRGVNGTGGVPADMITVSKGLGNGHAISAVLGKREIIDCYDQAEIAGTYTREVPPMAAALAVLDVIEDGSVHEQCEQMGRMLRDGMREILDGAGVPSHLAGPPMMFDTVVESDQLSWDFYRAAYDYGAYFEDSGTHMVTAAYGEAEVRHALDAFEQGVRQVLKSASIRPGPLPQERKMQFAREAFGGLFHDEPAVLERIEQTVRKVAERDRRGGATLDHACG
jgi:glutamate-1-semialdehyde 2,1-aminomutase